mgnify:CR=1 FL=1
MQVSRRETDNPRSRRPITYNLNGLTVEEFNTVRKSLELLKEDQTAAELLERLNSIEKGAQV